MKEDLQLGYLVLDVVERDRLNRIFTEVLGLLPQPLPQGSTGYRMDDWDRRFVLRPRGKDALAAVGLVARTPEVYAELVDRLRSTSVPLRTGSAGECGERAVREFVAFSDPAGTPLELAVGPASARSGTGYTSPLVPGGFLTGAQGLGHVVLLAGDRQASVDFYTRSLGFVVSDTSEDETPDGVSRATFLHCNRRHHTVAVVQRPAATSPGRLLGHFMIQANEFDAVGMAYDRAVDAQVPIFRSLGRHPNDRMFSFYGRTSAGFDIEFGAGAVEVGPDWQVHHYHQISAWGHRPGPGMPAREPAPTGP